MHNKLILLGLTTCLFWGQQAWGMEGSSTELGQHLFESTALGTTGKSCARCHPGGEGLRETGSYTAEQLREMINFCIRDALKGKPLPTGSQELEALYAYVRSLSPKE